jgi:hypothetical protein
MKTYLFVLLLGGVAVASLSSSRAHKTMSPLINGGSYVYFSVAAGTYHSGTITDTPGALVTVDVGAGGPPGGTYQTSFTLTGATLSGGSNTIYATSTGGATANNIQTFTMPSSGSVGFSGSFSEPNDDGSGSIGVQ